MNNKARTRGCLDGELARERLSIEKREELVLRSQSPRHVKAFPDEALIERVLAGERELYGVIVGRYQNMLYRFAAGMVQDPDAASDLVQDSFIKAYGSLRQCRDRQRFSAWIFRIVRNRCTDYLRAPSRRWSSLELAAAELSTPDTPEMELERREVGNAVEQALAKLPAAQREAFLLKHVEDLSYEEMAILLNASISALKMRVMRAREALQGTLREAGAPRVLLQNGLPLTRRQRA